MGIVVRQTIKGTIWSYLGVVIGFITTTYLYTEYLTPEIIGLLGILLAYANIFGRFANLGLQGVTNRLFTYFNNKEKGHNGFLVITLMFHFVGFGLFLILYYVFKSKMIELNIDKSPLLAHYLYLIVPITFATMLFIFLDNFNKVLYDAVFGTFLQEFLQRILLMTITLLYAFGVINLDEFVLAFAMSISIKALILLAYLFKKGEINLNPKNLDINPQMKREILNVALFNILGGLGSIIVFNLDKIIINELLDLSNTGVYTIAFYFGSMVAVPSRTLLKISTALIADSFKNNDLKKVELIYDKSCINQLIIGGVLFLGIWANIDNILMILGEDYMMSKWVIFFIGLGYLIDMSTGTNGYIIGLSKYFRINLLFLVILIISSLALMYLLIPIWGIVGASIAICFAILLNNLMRYIYLYKKFDFQPFKFSSLLSIVSLLVIYFLVSLIPQYSLYIDILIRGFFILVLSFVAVWFLPLSDDIKDILKKMLKLN